MDIFLESIRIIFSNAVVNFVYLTFFTVCMILIWKKDLE